MRFVVTNPKEVVEVGLDALKNQIQAGKREVESDIAQLIYNPCLKAVSEEATEADITGAFNYKGFPCRDGILTLLPERLIKYFVVEKEDTEKTLLRFNPDYREGYSIVDERILAMDPKILQRFIGSW